jgi:hypothetical protein
MKDKLKTQKQGTWRCMPIVPGGFLVQDEPEQHRETLSQKKKF